MRPARLHPRRSDLRCHRLRGIRRIQRPTTGSIQPSGSNLVSSVVLNWRTLSRPILNVRETRIGAAKKPKLHKARSPTLTGTPRPHRVVLQTLLDLSCTYPSRSSKVKRSPPLVYKGRRGAFSQLIYHTAPVRNLSGKLLVSKANSI